jgi:uncharacterized RDD family membrane protein YckC
MTALPPAASWPARALAWLLDAVVLTVATLAVIVPAELAGRDTALAVAPTLLVVVTAYFPLTMRRSGQTWGKQVARIRVVGADGRPPETGTIVVREVVGKFVFFTVLPFVALFIPTAVNFLWPLLDKHKQALHDKMASTLVVRADPALQWGS